MIISELNHLEPISEETRFVGGFFSFSFINIYPQAIEQISQYQTRTEDDDDKNSYAEASDDEDWKKAFSYIAGDSYLAIAYAQGRKQASAYTFYNGSTVRSYSRSVS